MYLCRLLKRYYDPRIGRFMGMDLAGFDDANPQTFNPYAYAYANNNPYKFVDPDGREATRVSEDIRVGARGYDGTGLASNLSGYSLNDPRNPDELTGANRVYDVVTYDPTLPSVDRMSSPADPPGLPLFSSPIPSQETILELVPIFEPTPSSPGTIDIKPITNLFQWIEQFIPINEERRYPKPSITFPNGGPRD